MSYGSGKTPRMAVPPPATRIDTEGEDKARLDMLERIRRGRSRQESRVTLNMLQSPQNKTNQTIPLKTKLGDVSTPKVGAGFSPMPGTNFNLFQATAR